MKRIIVILSLLSGINCFAEQRFGHLNNNVLEFYEKKITSILKKKSAKKNEFFQLYTEAAESLLAVGYYKYAFNYFEKSLNYKENDLPTFLRILETLRVMDSHLEHKKWVNKTFKLISSKKIPKSADNYKKYLLEANYSSFKKTGHPLEDAIFYFNKGNYSKSHSLFEKIDLTHSSLGYKVLKDLNQVIVNKKSNQLSCQKQFDRYPAAPSISIKICGELIHYLKKKTIRSHVLDWIKKELIKINPKELYLVQGLEFLRGRKR